MRKLFLGPDSPLWPTAIDLEMEGLCEAHLVRPESTELPASPGDQVLLGTSTDLHFFSALVAAAAEGQLADLTVVADHGGAALERLSWRARPWLRVIYEVIPESIKKRGRPPKAGSAKVPDVWPAPRRAVSDLDALMADWPAPRVSFSPRPSGFPARLLVHLQDGAGAVMRDDRVSKIVAQFTREKPDVIEFIAGPGPIDERLEAFAADARAAAPEALITALIDERALSEARARTLAAVMPVAFVRVHPPDPSLGSLEGRQERFSLWSRVFREVGGRLILATHPQADEAAHARFAAARGIPLEVYPDLRGGGTDLRPTHPTALSHHPFTTAVVSPQGDLTLGGADWLDTRVAHGSDAIAQTWTSAGYQSARRAHLDHPEVRSCEMSAPRDVP